jgi:maleate isomerase
MRDRAIDPLELFRRQTTSIGTIIPSGNIVVERITAAILRDFPTVSGHFSRTRVVGSSDAYLDDYDWDGMLGAAELLGHARLDAICWNGSKGGSIGFDADRRLTARIQETTGIPACTSTLAIEELFRRRGVARFGLVTPYAAGYAGKIPPHFAREGFACIAEAHSGLSDNFSYCTVPDGAIADMIRGVATSAPDAIIAYCTNFPAAPLVAALEVELGVPIYDSVSVGVWKTLRLAGIDTEPGCRWGSAFAEAVFPFGGGG